MKKLLFCLCIIWACSFTLKAQYINISGRIVNDTDNTSLPGVSVLLYTIDSLKQYTATTDNKGNFRIENVIATRYKLRAAYIGFYDANMVVPYSKTDVNLGTLRMKWDITTMKTAVIEGKVVPVQQREDTTEFNADAFKTHPDASSEDLVNKMPGVSSQNGSVTVNGEQVTQVLVDGEPFFGNDPAIALKNLPAEVVDKIQVFDKLSDQAQFTGFDDGNTQKTINIVTKKNKRNGTFGKGYAGYGTDDRYLAGGNLNLFNGASRFSILGLANNVNQQNFATEDILGALSGGGGGRGGRGGGGGGLGGGSGGSSSQGGGGYTSGANNFLIGTQNGITTTNSIGTNYTNAWNNNKIKLSGSYFFNNSSNSNNTSSATTYTNGEEVSNVLNETSMSGNSNYNNRLNARLQWNIDSTNSFIITVKGSTQQTQSSSSFYEDNLLGELLQSFSQTSNGSTNMGYDFSDNILYMHKFKRKGRTISLNVSSDVNNKNAPGNLYALDGYANDTSLVNQQSTQNANGYTISPSLSYTQPLDSSSLLQFNYTPSINISNINKQTFNYDSLTNTHVLVDTALSNQYQSTYLTQLGGISYRLNIKKKFFVMASANFQYSTLSSIEQLPESPPIVRYYADIVPRLVLNWRFSQSKNLRIMYRTNITPPSISQLQNVVNNSNPLLLSTGNPLLKQDYQQSFTARYGATNSADRTTFLVYLYGSYMQNYIGSATYIPLRDTLFGNGTLVQKGVQLSMPANLQGYWNSKTFITYGWLVKPIKCNLNFNGGLSYSNTPSLINNAENFSSNYTVSGGLVVSSNISENVDFTLGYTDNYSTVTNTLENNADDHYLNQVVTGKINLILLKGIVVNSSLTYTDYTGLSTTYNQNIWLWNASLGYKFLKQRALLISISAFDLLNQNKSITRTVTDTYIQDSQTQVLQRYFMLNMQYNIRKFKKSTPTPS